MPNIEYTLQTIAGSDVRGAYPDVNVLSKTGDLIRVPCAGCEFQERAITAEGHYVKVVASRYTEYNPFTIRWTEWREVRSDQAILGWRTAASSKSKVQGFVVFLLLDVKGQFIFVPRPTYDER